MAAIHVNEDNFEVEVLKSDKPVLVDFWATWCGPCQMMGPVLEELSEEQSDIKICKINVDDNGDLAQKYGIMSIPNFILFKNGEVAGQRVGSCSKEEMLDFIKG